jgi:hypothetical protein
LDTDPHLGYGWWRRITKRYEEVLFTKKGERFAKNWSDWSTKSNIKQMYNQINLNMIDAGIARKLESEVWMNYSGKSIENPDGQVNKKHVLDNNKPLGLKYDTKLIHPQYLLFFNETRCNTKQKKDVNAVQNQDKWLQQTTNTLPSLVLLLQQGSQYFVLLFLPQRKRV